MGQNSIKSNLSKEDIIAEIRLTLSADFCHEKSIVIVEGEDDICFLNGKLLPHVDVYESYSGKQGVKEIVRAFSDDRVIGICDRDYDPCTSNSGIYYYDYCCLEMMLVSNDTVFSNFCYGYYRGSKDPLLLREELLQQLEELSLYRKLSAENDWGIKFSGISFGNAVDDNGRLDIEEMINQIKSINPCFSTSIQSQVERIKDEAGRHNTLSERLMITQGHDFMHCFHQVCLRKVQRKQKSPSVVEMYRSLVCAYRPSDFSHTDLFSEISDYQRSCKRSVLVPIESVAI